MSAKCTWQYEGSDGTWRNYSAPESLVLEVSHRYYREHCLGKRVLIKLNERTCIVNFKKMRLTDILRCRRHKMRVVSMEHEARHTKVPGLNSDLNESSTFTEEAAPNIEGHDCHEEASTHDSFALAQSTEISPARSPEELCI
jgi:hypothetical protein